MPTEEIQQLLRPGFITHEYHSIFDLQGYLFFDGQKLSVIDAQWRKDDNPWIEPYHQYEYNLAQDPKNFLAEGAIALIIVYTHTGWRTVR